ncbi:MAG: DNA recombination protein RmuC [Acidimicrobiia bacterium]
MSGSVVSVLVSVVALVVVAFGAVGWFAAFLARRQREAQAAMLAEMQRTAEEQRRADVQDRETALTGAMHQLLLQNQATLEGERARGTEELGGAKQLIDQQLETMTGELSKVQEMMRRLEEDRHRQYGQLSEQLVRNTEGITSLNTTTQSLREALSSTKARGQWGERMAEDVLRLAGFIENVNYRKQTSPEGSNGIPDFTFFLPGRLLLHMDVKFPLDNYLRWLDAKSELDQKRHRDQFLRDVRARVRELATRDYIDPAGGTVDFVLLFIPNEQLYGFIHEQDGTILEEAVRERVVFCSPLTLFAVLALIRQSVENFHLARRSDEILTLLGQFSEQWGKYVEATAKLGRGLESVNRAYEDLAGTRRRMLERPLRKIDALRSHEGAELALDEGEDAADPPVTTLALEA